MVTIFKRKRINWIEIHFRKNYFSFKIPVIIACLTLFLHPQVFGQCTELNKGNSTIAADANSKGISVTTTSDINFSSVRIMLYNFNEAVYYYDSWKREKVKTDPGLIVQIFSKEINIRNLPTGDFTIMVEIRGCKEQALGLGYSGFPNSAIKIE